MHIKHLTQEAVKLAGVVSRFQEVVQSDNAIVTAGSLASREHHTNLK